MKKKFLALETFRGFAALMIAAIHFDVNSPLVNHSLANGYFVHFFFTLSGFVIYHNYKDKIQNVNLLKKFIIKRFWRLYPLHLFFLILFLFIEILKYFLSHFYGLEANNAAFTKNNLGSFFANFFLVNTFMTTYTFNTPSWSISAEMITYIFFAFTIFCTSQLKFIYLLLVIAFTIIIVHDSNFGSSNSGYLSLIDCIYCFFCGVISYKIYDTIKNKYVYKKYKNIFASLLIILCFSSLLLIDGKSSIIFPIIFSLTILFSCEIDEYTFLGKLLLNKIFIFLGKISYSIYMSHLFVFWLLTQIYRFIFKFETYIEVDTGFTKILLNPTQANFIVILSYSLTIFVSYYLFKYLENNYFYLKS